MSGVLSYLPAHAIPVRRRRDADRRVSAGGAEGLRHPPLGPEPEPLRPAGALLRYLGSMDQRLYLKFVQMHVAQRSIGPSTVRGAGRGGTAEAARTYLASLNLMDFSGRGMSRFEHALDMHTERLRAGLPRSARHWGLARKCLNIFLRDATEHHVLRIRFNLAQVESRLEIPLDRHTATELRARDTAGLLPRWRTIKHLTPEDNSRYQALASKEAARAGTTRVFLDAMFWRGSAHDLGRPSSRDG